MKFEKRINIKMIWAYNIVDLSKRKVKLINDMIQISFSVFVPWWLGNYQFAFSRVCYILAPVLWCQNGLS
jgi:hypothetical protein